MPSGGRRLQQFERMAPLAEALAAAPLRAERLTTPGAGRKLAQGTTSGTSEASGMAPAVEITPSLTGQPAMSEPTAGRRLAQARRGGLGGVAGWRGLLRPELGGAVSSPASAAQRSLTDQLAPRPSHPCPRNCRRGTSRA